jgi:hypothetical protein
VQTWLLSLRGAYLARFHTVRNGLPNVLTPFHVSSSPVRVNGRFTSVPVQFGNEPPSTRR